MAGGKWLAADPSQLWEGNGNPHWYGLRILQEMLALSPPRGRATRPEMPTSSEGPIVSSGLQTSLSYSPGSSFVSLALLALGDGTCCHHCHTRTRGISLRPREMPHIGAAVARYLGLSCGHTKCSLKLDSCWLLSTSCPQH